MERSGICELHSLQPVANLASILQHGILSHEQARRVPHVDIADASVQAGRAAKRVPSGARIHAYTCLFFDARTPMMYSRLDQVNGLVVLTVDPRVIDTWRVRRERGRQTGGRCVGAWHRRDGERVPLLPVEPAAEEAISVIERVIVGDLFESPAQTLVNTVNTVGVMGKGIALGFKQRFPEMFRDYERRAKRGEVRLGEPFIYKRLALPWVINFPTKDHWRSVTRLADIERGLEYLEAHYREWGIESLAVPPLGCGEGKLEWRVVGKTLYRHLQQLEIPVTLYAPFDTPSVQLTKEFLESDDATTRKPNSEYRVSPGAFALVEVVARVSAEPHHWPIGQTVFHKLAYFATSLGIPTGLRFDRRGYGPHSSDMGRLRSKLVNNGLIEEEMRGRRQEVLPGRTYADARSAYQAYLDRWEMELDRLTDLLLRLDRVQLEAASTVHLVVAELRKRLGTPPSERSVMNEVKRWKPESDPSEIAQSIRDLNALGWIDVHSSDDLPVIIPIEPDVALSLVEN